MKEMEHLKAVTDTVYQQLADNLGIGIPVDPDLVDFMGIPEASDPTDDGDIQVTD